LVSSTPALDLPSSPSVEADTITPTVNGTSHHEAVVNGNQTATSPPATDSPSNPAPEPSLQPPQHLQQQSDAAQSLVTEAPSEPISEPLASQPIDISEGLQLESTDAPQTEPQISSDETPSLLPPSHTVEQETSFLRQEPQELKEEKHQLDLAADSEMAEAADQPLPHAPPTDPEVTEPAVEDKMDIAMTGDNAAAEPTTDLPHRPQSETDDDTAKTAPEPAPELAPESASQPASAPTPPTSDKEADQEMLDAPVTSVKVSREREEDTQEEERAAKRSKTDDMDSSAEFKVPELPLTRSTESGTANGSAITDTPVPLTTPQQKHLLKVLSTIKRQKDATAYKYPVDPAVLNIPTYFDVVKNPMDLSTMEKKLKDSSYTTLEEVVGDFDLMVSNALAFNGLEHGVTKSGQKIRASFEDHLRKLPSADTAEPTAAETKAQKAAAVASTKVTTGRRQSRSGAPNPRSPANNAGSPSTQTFALNPEGIPLIRRDSMAQDGRPKREIHPPRNRGLDYGASKPKKKKYAWELKFCQYVWDEIKKPRYYHIASIFYDPVDPVALNIPNYHKVIKRPMDLGTIGTKLKHGQYENAKEFEDDVRLMFQNCYKFNHVGEWAYTSGKNLEHEFDLLWERKKKWISDNAPNSNPQSQGTSPDPEEEEEEEADEEEEEVDDGDEQLTILQKQIAAMSKQVEMIQKKKASPPAASKKSKNKPVKKEKKPSTSGPASKKKAPGKPVKPEKIPIVSYEQKKLISDRINDLSEVKMGQALRIIRENVPHLRVSCLFLLYSTVS
jgi:bromodomain-containing factor 1